MAHVHESPLVMLVPMSVLAFGAVFAGWIGYRWFVGADMDSFWHGALFVLPQHPALEDAHHVPVWVSYLPLAVGLAGILLAYVMYMFIPGLPARIAGSVPRRSTCSSSTSGTSTSFTTGCSSARRSPSAAASGRAATAS